MLAAAGIDRASCSTSSMSPAGATSTEVKIPQCVVDRNFPLRFTTALLHKDVKLCLDEAARQRRAHVGQRRRAADAAVRHLAGDGPVKRRTKNATKTPTTFVTVWRWSG